MISILIYVTGSTQTYQEIDTIPTHDYYNHLFLKINSPSGNIYVKPAEQCGHIVTQLQTHEQSLTQQQQTRKDSFGNVYLTYSIEKNQHPQTFNARMAIPKALSYEEKETYTAMYTGDPNIPTNLWINMGSGSSKIDLSQMTLNNLRVQSAMSDVHITYSSPNKTDMHQMEIHVASANIKLENIEYARAEVINIRNDMGNTEISMGIGYKPATNVHIMSGTGDCTIRIKQQQPVKITLRNGMFSHAKISGSFEQLSDKVYANSSYRRSPKGASMIICETDLGSIHIVEIN